MIQILRPGAFLKRIHEKCEGHLGGGNGDELRHEAEIYDYNPKRW